MEAKNFIIDYQPVMKVKAGYKKVNGKIITHWFQREQDVLPWIAKQAMLEIFDKWDHDIGTWESSPGDPGSSDLTVWCFWSIRKANFIKDLKEHDLDYARQQLELYFETDCI